MAKPKTITATTQRDTVTAESYGVTSTWSTLFGELPKYDPIATAGDCVFNASVADNVVSFFENQLTHIEGELSGKPLKLEPWQKAIVGCAFGWLRPDGTRRYRKVFQFVPRKNGKTCMVAGLVLLMALCDGERGAQIYSAAAEREQAAIIYRNAAAMLANNPRLQERAKCYVTTKAIQFNDNTIYRALSADAKTKHGFNSHFIIGDELHSMRSDELLRTLETSTGSRRQPLIWYITTADYDRVSVCNDEYEYACKVRDGIIHDPAHLPVIFEAGRDDDYLSPAVWRKANPNYGVSIKPEYLEKEAARAKALPSYRNTFKRLHLNIRTQTNEAAIDMALWDRCDHGPIDEASLSGRKAWIGLDFSSTRDTTAAVLCVAPLAESEPFIIIPRIYIPKASAIEREKEDKVPYLAWSEGGHIRFTAGNFAKEVDYKYISDDLADWFTGYNVRAVLGDPFQANQFLQQLAEQYGVEVQKVLQRAWSMHNPIVEFERIYTNGQLSHAGHPVLRWMASNVSSDRDRQGHVRWQKTTKTGRIDGIIAAVMSLAGALQKVNEAEVTESQYAADEGLFIA